MFLKCKFLTGKKCFYQHSNQGSLGWSRKCSVIWVIPDESGRCNSPSWKFSWYVTQYMIYLPNLNTCVKINHAYKFYSLVSIKNKTIRRNIHKSSILNCHWKFLNKFWRNNSLIYWLNLSNYQENLTIYQSFDNILSQNLLQV